MQSPQRRAASPARRPKGYPKPPKGRDGRCYELAAKFVLERDMELHLHTKGRPGGYPHRCPWVLVHGAWRNPDGSAVDHAWVEINGFPWDPTFDQMYEPESWRSRVARVDARFDAEELRRMVLKHRTYGPWPEETAEART